MAEASAAVGEDRQPGQGHAESYPRLRAEVAAAVDSSSLEEFERLFPAEFSTAGRSWAAQGDEAVVHMRGIAGWLDGMVEGAILERRIRAEAEEKARRFGLAQGAES